MGLADVKEKALTGLFWLSALMIVGVLVLIIGYIIVNGISAIDLKFILEPPSRAVRGRYFNHYYWEPFILQ